jgi:hypothetical protein
VVLSVVVYQGTPGEISEKYLLGQERNLQQWADGDITGLERLVRTQVRGQASPDIP